LPDLSGFLPLLIASYPGEIKRNGAMGKYVIDTYKITATSEIRVGASDHMAKLHVLDLIPNTFVYNNIRVPYLTASGLHGVWKAALRKISENSNHSFGKIINELMGYIDRNGSSRGRLRFGHAFPGKASLKNVNYRIWARNKLDDYLQTSQDKNLNDELTVPEGYIWFFSRMLRCPDKNDNSIEEYLNYLELIDRAFNKNLMTIGSGRAPGKGHIRVERVERRQYAIEEGRIKESIREPIKDSDYDNGFSLFGRQSSNNTTAGNNGETICFYRITNLGELETRRELIQGSTIWGGLCALAIEMSGTYNDIRVRTQMNNKIVVDTHNCYNQGSYVTKPEPDSLIYKLREAWAKSKFKISPFIPSSEETGEGECPVAWYNRCAQKVYTEDAFGYRYYKNQTLHMHNNIESGQFYHSDEIKPASSFIGFFCFQDSHTKAIFESLLEYLFLADIGKSKHTLLKIEPIAEKAYSAIDFAPPTNTKPHLISRQYNSYTESLKRNNAFNMKQQWTGPFPTSVQNVTRFICNTDGGRVNYRASRGNVVQNGWACPPAGEPRGIYFMDGIPCHNEEIQEIRLPADITLKDAFLHGIGELAEWKAIGFGQIVFI
jgi:hypothetical protein